MKWSRIGFVAMIGSIAVLSLALTRHRSAEAGPQAAATDVRIRRVETSLRPVTLGAHEPPLALDLPKLMQLYRVPAVSIAVIDNYEIAWAKGYGVTEAGGTESVTTHTLFQAGSISKPVSASGALKLVEQGKLSLDEDVNKKLVSWKVPENEFTKDQKVTLRRLMSHSGGLTVHGFPGYAAGEPVPSVVQVLNGEKPANTNPVRVFFVPGTKSEYSGGGITIEQLLMQDVTRKAFPALMQELVLGPVGMNESTFEQPLPGQRVGFAASGTYASGKVVPGKRHVYPEMAAAGLWTTPTDLAKFAIEIALSRQGKANHVLSESMAKQMLTPQFDTVGLGFFLNDAKNPVWFGHGGSDEGFQAQLVMFLDGGQGVAIMADSDNGIRLGNFLMESVAKEYAWKTVPFKPSADDLLLVVANAKGADAAVAKYDELKKSQPGEIHENTLNGLGYAFLSADQITDAIVVFRHNVAEYPQSWNPYDSLGEAYMRAGQKELAIQNYEKSIELNPKNQNGIEMLKKLKRP